MEKKKKKKKKKAESSMASWFGITKGDDFDAELDDLLKNSSQYQIPKVLS